MVAKISYQDLEDKIKELESEIASLRQIKEKYDALFYHSPFEVHIWEVVRDKNGNIKNWAMQDANSAALKAWGLMLSDIVGKTPDQIFPDTNPVELFLPIVEKIFSEQEPYLWEHYIPDTNQTLQMVSFPVGDTFLSVGLDITEKKRLQEAQLRSSQLSTLGEVAAGVAHEINNPINGVINYAQILINKNDGNDELTQMLERILKEGNRISSIVKNLLNFAQKDRGLFSSFSLRDIVVDPLSLQEPLFANDNIQVEIEIPDDLPSIYGNKIQLEQVVLNLLSNARYALNKKFPGISSEKIVKIQATSSFSKGDGDVQLRIKDYGCGIPKGVLMEIFHPFFTTKELGVGTGLGLSISHEILETHHASISVNSQVGMFTEFTITFPVNSENDS